MMRMLKHRSKQQLPNMLASAILSAAIGVLYFSYDPSPADADPNDMAVVAARPIPVPVIAYKPTEFSESNQEIKQDGQAQTQQQPGTLTGRMALLMNQLLLEKGCRLLDSVSDYTTTFSKQEYVGGALTENQVINLKCRHKPFSVYMKWVVGDKGQELLYVDGENDQKMLVKMGGLKGRLMPTLKLDPHGSLAMQESRYPITKAGIRALAEEIIGFRKKDLAENLNTECVMLSNQKFDGKDCYCFIAHFANAKESPTYRKSVIYIDQESCLPVFVRGFGWPREEIASASPEELDEQTLIESYSFTDINLKSELATADFSESNSDYRFRR
ncbi:DUF1571 domain-containing protein [Gimesia chilikensis]|uniref:DUF1571 domain-containing protein n=1 Tax=Gimesia chilikensis TaxID=2605989 RepID=A0A517PP24_9PLAN|nr:DUF1571 domain-containing protein [Gimesia chilikensis]MCR9229543.1 DUF1571 domain-containing protein [bacterium]QDT21114.1 hypothetical protein HG66A1_29070 [Gimesia chilikensis]QDT84448.1 hypothetical protein MalM14_21080 [Gimesia chilikensis]